MTQEQFRSYMENFDIFDRMKANLPNLQIDWETDISKIDLSVLVSNVNVPETPGTKLVVEFIDMKNIVQNTHDLFIDGDIERFIGLYELIENGVKIIPPVIHRGIEFIEGKASPVPQCTSVHIHDGEHRLRLARHLNLEKIPVVVIESPCKYYFSKSLWNIECKGDMIEMKQKNSETTISLPLANCQGNLTLTGDYLFFFR